MWLLYTVVIISVASLVLAVFCKPTRKALGLFLCFLGFLECCSVIGLIIGLPTFFVGAILLFI
jgi:hypothetical protein